MVEIVTTTEKRTRKENENKIKGKQEEINGKEDKVTETANVDGKSQQQKELGGDEKDEGCEKTRVREREVK